MSGGAALHGRDADRLVEPERGVEVPQRRLRGVEARLAAVPRPHGRRQARAHGHGHVRFGHVVEVLAVGAPAERVVGGGVEDELVPGPVHGGGRHPELLAAAMRAADEPLAQALLDRGEAGRP
jgi:hypothetical protein